MLAMDRAQSFDMSLPAMNDLTGGQASALGRVPVVANQVANSFCGL